VIRPASEEWIYGRISKVVVYASHPVQRVVGEFEIDEILALNQKSLWKKTKRFSGIAKTYFDDYFGEKETAYAIKIKGAKRYEQPVILQQLCPSARPPQSFMYLPH
jgi:predicted transcriptional regulator